MATTKQLQTKKQILNIQRMLNNFERYLDYLDANAKK